jgi:hypothetical protein
MTYRYDNTTPSALVEDGFAPVIAMTNPSADMPMGSTANICWAATATAFFAR